MRRFSVVAVPAVLLITCGACSTTYQGTQGPGATADAGTDITAGSGEVGSACGTCDTGLVCETQVEGGYCTKACERHFDCPGTSRCVAIGTASKFCLKSCFDAHGCRSGHTCAGELASRVCVPPQSTGT